ncbi:sigma-70 family RNA polymerase sigma factor [Streptomyces sp. NPDC007164]|uniref:RNA polymerase sigma factor n=1 Tax=Streptomyces sp. NPDC007164 TaxID=3156918 RepID=UPI0033DCEBDC
MSQPEPAHLADEFAEFVRQTSDRYYRAAMAETGYHPANAEDAVQSTYLSLFTRWPRLRETEGSIERYGRTTLHNAVRTEFRRTARQAVPTAPQEMPEGIPREGDGDPAYISVHSKIVDVIVGELIPALPEQQKRVVTLCLLEDLTTAEAAEVLQIKEDTVKRYLTAAKNRIQKMVLTSSKEVTA